MGEEEAVNTEKKLAECLDANDLVLMEAAVIESLRRGGVELHPSLENALLVTEPGGRAALKKLYKGFVDLAVGHNLPILLATPTWRANPERLAGEGLSVDFNAEAAGFLLKLREEYGQRADKVLIGGLMGCKNDSYRPEEGLDQKEAFLFHEPQARALAGSGVDYLMAATLPCLSEALGMAQALSRTGLEYIISFVINSQGRILDGTSLDEAFATIDRKTGPQKPLGFMINCAHPSFLKPKEMMPKNLARLMGYQANASSLDHDQLDNAKSLESDDLKAWVRGMLDLNMEHGINILGGCCGTTSDHLKELILQYKKTTT